MTNTLTTEQIARLSCLMEGFQLDKFLTACEVVRDAGDGYGEVSIMFTNHSLNEIEGKFTIKPRRDQSALLRGGRAP